ncbi:hypothetical protein [Aquibium microcysteis]|uniref:hypothetical protein n=1 Tax=Aquibium microcysteis TaxID=675281 RepID=UPI00165D007C|nr:hypothetical protein [Aquibium microcysteis]
MSSGYIILFELVLVLGLALVFGVRELRNLRRFDRERAERNRQAAATARRAEDGQGGD